MSQEKQPYYGQAMPGKPGVVTPVPTQTRHPVRAMLRTLLAVAVPLLALLPQIVESAGLEKAGWVAGLLAITASITRVLAVPGINTWLSKYLPPLAAAPAKP